LRTIRISGKLLVVVGLLWFASIKPNLLHAQSFELLLGTERLFIDAQYLSYFEGQGNNKWSLFSRARATSAYDAQSTDLFMGGYLNYTTAKGFGATVLGRISSFNAGIDVGPHFFKASSTFLVYALPSININDELLYSWFSILRFTPTLNEKTKLFSSIELFSAFDGDGHLSSVQRLRLGLDKKGYQFGLGVNLTERGRSFSNTDVNPGVFLRKQF